MAKAFKITQNNQYIQNINLNAGEYTFSAWIRADNITYKFGFRKLNNQLIEFDISDQLVFQQWVKVRLTFQLTEQAKEFSLMSSGAGNGRTYYVMNPMLEEGSNAGTPKPNELDLEELVSAGSVNIQLGIPFYKFQTGDDNKTVYHMFDIPIYATSNGSPITIQANQITVMTIPPTGLTIQPGLNKVTAITNGMNSTVGRIQIRVVIDGINYFVYFEFSCEPLAKDGKSPYIGENGNWWVWDSAQNKYIDSGDSAHGDDGKSPEIRDDYWWAWDGTEWYNTGVKAKGDDGKSPYIGENGNWWVWDDDQGEYVDSGDSAIGDDGKSPYIGANGNWWVWNGSEYVDTGIKAKGEDGHSPYIGENGNWWIWDSVQNKYVDSGDPAHGDDGKSPEIRDGYWWVWENGQWSNTGIKAEGENAKWLKLNSTSTQIKVDRNDNSVPASITVFAQLYNLSGTATWTYSVNGGTFTSTAPTGVVRTANQVVITTANVTFEVLSIKAKMGDVEDTISISRVVDGKDGARGLPGKMPIKTEWVAGREYNNNDELVHYIYYRAGNTWWKLKDGIESKVAGSTPDTTFFEQLSSAEVLIADVILANRANLGGLIFNDEMLVSQKGYDTAGNILNFGEYIEFQFAVGGISSAPTSGWADLPPTTETNPPSYLWMRFKKNTATIWKSGRLTGASPDYSILYSASKDGTYYGQPYQSGRYWAMITAISESAISDSEFNSTIYKITQTGEYDFNELLRIDGVNGSIKINSLSVPFTAIDPDSDFTNKLVNLRNIFIKASNPIVPIDYRWKSLYLPDGKQYDGMEFSIYTDGSYRRLKLLPQGSNSRIFTNEPAPIISAIKIPLASNERIHLKSVWNPNRQVTEWYMNRTSYRGGQPGGYSTPNEIPTYFKRGDVIAKGYFSSNAWNNQYCSWSTTGVTAVNTSGTVRITIPRISYYGDSQSGSPILTRTDLNPLHINIDAHPISVGNRMTISEYVSGDSVFIDIREYNSSGTLLTSPNFYFTIRANDYIVNSNTWDNKYDDWV